MNIIKILNVTGNDFLSSILKKTEMRRNRNLNNSVTNNEIKYVT